MSQEVWKDVPGYEGSYQVSSLGAVRSLDRVIEQECRWGSTIRRRHKGRILSQTPDQHGYNMIALGRANCKCVHRIVALAFIGPRPLGNQVRHLDGNPGNNKVENIAYGTCSENRLDAVRHGTHYSYFTTEEGKRYASSEARREAHVRFNLTRPRTAAGQFQGKT